MFENVINFFKKIGKKDQIEAKSKDTAKERLTNAEIDFIIDDNGSVLINEKDFDKAVLCCT